MSPPKFAQDDDLDYEAAYEDEDDEGPFESLLRRAPEIEAGLMPGWKLDRSQAGAVLWTTPSGDSTSQHLTAARTSRTGTDQQRTPSQLACSQVGCPRHEGLLLSLDNRRKLRPALLSSP